MKFFLVFLSIFALIFASAQAVNEAVCSQPKVIGPCRMAAFVYFFNSETKQCEKFIYGGCQGNDNRFNTLEECEKTCL